METNQKCGDGLTGTQKEASLRSLIQRTGYQLHQVRGITDTDYNIHNPLLQTSNKKWLWHGGII